ncbi:MAG: cytochrome c [Chloroflexi bacterium]|nr:cytochrome c [Chloroflexota bacterium]
MYSFQHVAPKRATLRVWVLAVLVLWAAVGCSGLGGEPEVVSTLRPAPSLAAPATPIADPMAAGAQIFAARCATCHGPQGRGDGDLVASGQIDNIPDMTDPTRRPGVTLEDYYEIITNGRIENLMPPWRDALSEDERRAVAQYAYSLIDLVALEPASTPEVTAVASTDTSTDSQPEATETGTDSASEAPSSVGFGTVEGTINVGTAGAALPEGLETRLFVFSMAGEEVLANTAVAEGGRYRFEDVPIDPQYVYMTSTTYNEVTFVSDMQTGGDAVPETGLLDMPLTIYDVTSDPADLAIDLLLHQAAPREDGTLEVLLVTQIENLSDKVYRQATFVQPNRYGVVPIQLPAGAVPIGLDSQRYIWDQASSTVIDTLPVVPGTDHIIHVSYVMPFDEGGTTLTFNVDYPMTNQPELMLVPGQFRVESEQFQSQGTLQFSGGTFEDYVGNPLNAGDLLIFTLYPSDPAATPPSPQLVLGVVLTVVGIATTALAGILIIQQRRSGPRGSESLVAQIAQLDLLYRDGQIAEDVYESRRKKLKDQLAEVLRKEKRGKS